MWGVAVPIDLSCPPWCVEHLARDVDAGRRTHRGPELVIEVAEVVFIGVVRRVIVRLCARDRAESRQCFIELVDPHGAVVELTVADARTAANMFLRSADLRLEPAEGPCPSWCEEHRAPDPDDPEDGLEHRGPYLAMVVPGHNGFGVTIGTRVSAFDENGSRRVVLYMVVQSIATELEGDEACKLVAHLLDCSDLGAVGIHMDTL